MSKGRHVRKRGKRAIFIGGAVLVALLIAAGGAAYAAYRYEQSRSDRILPGVRISGVDVGGLTRAEAERALKAVVEQTLSEPLTVVAGDTRWIVTQAELGRNAKVDAALDEALAVGEPMGTFDRFWHRVRDEPMDVDIELTYSLSGGGITRLVDQIAGEVYVAFRNAGFGLTPEEEDVVFIHARAGTKLVRAPAAAEIRAALDQGLSKVRLEPQTVHAKIQAADLGRNIVVRVSENRLYLYEGFEVIGEWDVATGKPGYTTPAGVWNVWDMRENPTWYNPALDSWGAGLPAVVPGGPGNPMGTRAIYIDAPGLIRIHGTSDDSSIGRYASHGCIRMHNWEIEELFEMIDIGQKVIVVGHRPADAGYWDSPGTSDI
jgi:lipoprotein-anchoring transpeptidase ErfK/SrfK